MKYKLIDFRPGEVEEVETGTCELYFGTTFICNEVFVFEDENGKEYEVETIMQRNAEVRALKHMLDRLEENK